MAHQPHIERPHPARRGGVQRIYKFDNGRGASVVRFYGSYGYEQGLWELAVLLFEPNGNWSIDYTTPVTDDVLGYQSDDDIEAVLDTIAALPALEAA